MPHRLTAGILLALALICTAGTMLRLDIIMLGQALLALGLIVGFHDLHRQRRALMLGLTDAPERERAELAVAQRLAFQDVIARTLSVLVRCDRGSFAAAMTEALRNVAGVCRSQTAIIYQLDWDEELVTQVHVWREVATERPRSYPMSIMKPALAVLAAGKPFGFCDPATLPPESATLATLARATSTDAALFVPVVRDGSLWGVLGVYRSQPGPAWNADDEETLRTLADVLIGAHARHQAEEQVVAAMQAAQAGSRAKGEFLANMSHEIRTPLNAIIGLADLLQQLEPTPQQRQYLEMVDSAGQTLLSLVDDVLDLARIESGEVQLESAPVNLVETAAEVVNVLALQAERKGIELVLRVAPDLPAEVVGDPLRLQQILLNLLGNALKFTSSGFVEVALARTANGVRVRVEDSGIGIAPSKLREIFAVFSQADASHTRRYGGSGLGLSICQRLVDVMGGSLRVESAVGLGSTFTVDVPLPAVNAAAAVEVEPRLANRRALVARGPARTCTVVVEALRALGISTETVASADAATAALRRDRWDLLILDDRAEDDEIALCEAAWRQQGDARPRVVMLAGPDSASRATSWRDRDRAWVVPRPVDPRRLRRVLLDVLAVAAVAESKAAPSEETLPFVRVLLAEDNPVNQKVAVSLLKTLGCLVTVVTNGRQAVAAAIDGTFDLVLMDCHMPEMDGLEATRRIRALPAPAGAVPVVAITANVLGEHRQACAAAGMDDFVTKPINRETLRGILQKWTASAALEVA